VGPSVRTRDVDLQLARERLRVSVKDTVVLDAQLWRAIDVEESTWEMEEHNGVQSVVVELAKKETWERWEHLTKRSGTEGDNYTWEQCGRFNEEVRIHIPVPDDVHTNDVDFSLVEGMLKVGLKGQEPIIDGQLWGKIDMKEFANWYLDDHQGRRCIIVSLEKVNVREGWERLLVRDSNREDTVEGSSGPEPGTRKDMDMQVLGQLEHVEYLLQQRRLDDAQRFMGILTHDCEEEAEKEAEEFQAKKKKEDAEKEAAKKAEEA
jgi:hypothetical protein